MLFFEFVLLLHLLFIPFICCKVLSQFQDMSFCKKLLRATSSFLKRIDLFPTSQFIRYNSDSDYTTVTGGTVSLAVLAICIILFASMAIKTVNRQIINSSITVSNENDPSPLSVVTSPNGGFMFFVGINGVNLNDPAIKYFNFTLRQNHFHPIFQLINSTDVPLVMCTPDHFSFSGQIGQMYNKLALNYCLCPPLGYSFTVGGKLTSNIFSLISLDVSACDSGVDPLCANSTTLSAIQAQAGGVFTLGIPIINSIINPSDQTYLSYYFEDRNYFSFNPSIGITSMAYIQQSQIDTDNSIMPYQEIITQKVVSIPSLFQSTSAPVNNQIYAQIKFVKAATRPVYQRSFKKIDQYFSYVGGLVGIIVSLMFILNAYSQKAYEMSIASRLFLLQQNIKIPSKKFNFFYFLSMIVKHILDVLKLKTNWTQTEIFIKCESEIEKQLDLSFLLNKVMFLERALQMLFDQHQFAALFLRGKPTIEQVIRQRKKHQMHPQTILYSLNKIDGKVSNIQGSQAQIGSDININEERYEIPKEHNIFTNKQQNQQLDNSVVSGNSSESEPDEQEVNKFKLSIEMVMNDSVQGNPLSRRLAKELEPQLIHSKGRELLISPQRTVEINEKRLIQNEVVQKKEIEIENFEYNFQE